MRPQDFDSQHALRGWGNPTALHNVKGHAVGVNQHCPQGLQIDRGSQPRTHATDYKRSCLKSRFDTQNTQLYDSESGPVSRAGAQQKLTDPI